MIGAKSESPLSKASRRERQILEILYRRGEVSAQEVRQELPGDPNYSSVRTLLRILEEKGQVRHREEDGRYLYSPAVSREKAGRSAVHQLVRTFFDGSVGQAAAALLDPSSGKLTGEDLDRLSEMIERARKEMAK